MGKIRVKTFGDEEQEKKDQKKAQARAEAKKARETAEAKKTAGEDTDIAEEKKPVEAAPEKKIKGKEYIKTTPSKKNKHSKSYNETVAHVEKKQYKLTEALTLLDKLKRAKFDETVELHVNTIEKGVSGSVTLPHGTGKTSRIAIANAATDSKGVDELVKHIEAGRIDFDVLIATPDAMPKLAKVARILGPKGLMPNPKNGTVSPKPDDVAKKFAGGQINFKTEAKFPIIHLAVGKISFGDKKLAENITTVVKAIKTKNVKNITLKSTMSPGIRLDSQNL